MADKPVRKFAKLPYEKILELIQAGVISACPKTATIKMRGRVLTQVLDRKEKYFFVRLYWRGARCGLVVHRLVWMSHYLRVVPAGYDVHHKDRDSHNNTLKNLQLRELHNHRSEAARGYPADWDEVQDTDAEWEEFVHPAAA